MRPAHVASSLTVVSQDTLPATVVVIISDG